MATEAFLGCKLALIQDRWVLVYERDTHVPYPSMWDLPGGGREGDETPEDCVLRELEEEFGLRLPAERLKYRCRHHSAHTDSYAFFFVGDLYESEVATIRFGTEGKCWRLMNVDDYLQDPAVLPHHQRWLRQYFTSTGVGAA